MSDMWNKYYEQARQAIEAIKGLEDVDVEERASCLLEIRDLADSKQEELADSL